MKLIGLEIEDFRQFKNLRLDFTDPGTGEPLEKVCFIGPNGTGKSTLLRLLGGCCFGKEIEQIQTVRADVPRVKCTVLTASGEQIEVRLASASHPRKIPDWLSQFLAIYCPSEGERGPTGADPKSAVLNDALRLLKQKSTKHVIGQDRTQNFWLRVVGHIKDRESDFLTFQTQAQNQQVTIAEFRSEFERTHPQILDVLSDVWNKILILSDLEFDKESVKIPVQLTDSLQAYLRTKSTQVRVRYDALSTGIRHYLFRLGHIWSLHFNRPPGDSILLVDEPEGSLYPDFLYDIVENYREVAPGCQLFMASHSPIVASQFKPEERFILTFGDDGYVTARRGTSPEGDDPNDILRQDFGVESLMTEVGEAKWQRFLKLRRLIPTSKEPERSKLIAEYTQLGTAYHFPVPGGHNGEDA